MLSGMILRSFSIKQVTAGATGASVLFVIIYGKLLLYTIDVSCARKAEGWPITFHRHYAITIHTAYNLVQAAQTDKPTLV